MEDKRIQGEKPDPRKSQILGDLPEEITRSLTNKKQVRAILCEDGWPDSLREKLNTYALDGQ